MWGLDLRGLGSWLALFVGLAMKPFRPEIQEFDCFGWAALGLHGDSLSGLHEDV